MYRSVNIKTSFTALLLTLIVIFYSCHRVSGDPPVAGFTYTSVSSVPLPVTVQFVNTSTTPAGVTATYTWDFGDGSPTSTVTNPTHSYVQAATYMVRLIQTPSTGIADTTTRDLILSYFTGPSGSSSRINSAMMIPSRIYTTTFINTSTGADGYLWKFGDGTTSTTDSVSFTHTFNAGTFHVNLTATNNNGTDTSGAVITF